MGDDGPDPAAERQDSAVRAAIKARILAEHAATHPAPAPPVPSRPPTVRRSLVALLRGRGSPPPVPAHH